MSLGFVVGVAVLSVANHPKISCVFLAEKSTVSLGSQIVLQVVLFKQCAASKWCAAVELHAERRTRSATALLVKVCDREALEVLAARL